MERVTNEIPSIELIGISAYRLNMEISLFGYVFNKTHLLYPNNRHSSAIAPASDRGNENQRNFIHSERKQDLEDIKRMNVNEYFENFSINWNYFHFCFLFIE